MKRPPIRTILLTLWASVAGCAIHKRGPTATNHPPPIVLNAAEEGTINRLASISKLETYIQESTAPDVIPWAMAWAGEQRRLAGDDAEARHWWESIKSTYPDHFVANIATLGLAVLNSREDPQGNTLATLQMIDPKGQPDSLNADRYRLLARVAHQDSAPKAEVDALVRKALEYAQNDPSVYGRATQMLEDLVPPEDLVTHITPVDPEQKAAAAIHSALIEDRFEDVIAQGQDFLNTWPESDFASRVSYEIRRAEAEDPTVPDQITVLLPLSGKYAKLGENLQTLITLANESVNSPMTLLFEDTTAALVDWEPTKMVAEDGTETLSQFDHSGHIQNLVEKAVLQDGSIAILGPMLKEYAEPSAQTAQALGVPMLSLSRAFRPTEAGDFVFRGQLSDYKQVEALVHHAVQQRGMKELALVHPNNSYGAQIRSLFEEAIEKQGGTLIRVASYESSARQFEELAQELGQIDPNSVDEHGVKLTEEEIGELSPTVDFEGVFIADGWKRAAMIANALAYSNFHVGEFRPHKQSPQVHLMGLNTWHDPRIVEIGGMYIQHSTFVDAFAMQYATPEIDEWVRYYKENFNQQKPKVHHAVTWDTTRLLAAAIVIGGTEREDIRDALVEAQLDGAISSGTQFGEDREMDRKLLILSIEDKAIVPWVGPEDDKESGDAIAP